MKNRGFTMVVLIVTIAIMGIILMVTFPSVDKLQRTNKYKKMVSYGESMLASSKLYVEQYAEDMWGSMNAVGEREVSMATLKNANLMKDYQDKQDTCSSGKVVIRRTGSPNHYKYSYYYTLTCQIRKKTVVCNNSNASSNYNSTCTEGGRKVYP